MELSFWQSKWREGQIGFHRDEVHPDLLLHGHHLLDGAGVLVPLCGKSVDLVWLAERRPVVGVELSELAVDQLVEEQELSATRDRVGPYQRVRAGDLTVLQGDMFALSADHLPSPVDRVWDRAALVALDPPRRRRYAATVRALLPAGARLLVNTFTYDKAVMDGPPHSVAPSEVAELYPGATITTLDERDELTPRFAELGHTWWTTHLLRVQL